MAEQEYTVSYVTYTDLGVTIRLDPGGLTDDELRDAIVAAADEKFFQEVDTGLCHACARKVNLGNDWEPQRNNIEGLDT